MKRKPLFFINKQLLFREFDLINVNYPELYVCVDNNQKRYLVLSTDFFNDTYIIVPISLNNIKKMICGEIPVKEPFENADNIYFVKPSSILTDDNVREIYFNEIDNITDFFKGEDYFLVKHYISNVDEYLEKLSQITTNFEKLKSMTQDEVVKYMEKELCEIYEGCDGCPMYYYICIRDEFVKWLEMPFKVKKQDK